MSKLIDLTGLKFGRWSVIRKSTSKHKNTIWLCKCECGTEKEVAGDTLKNGVSKSCGCLRKEITSKRKTTHSEASIKRKSPEYRSWTSMKTRCTNPKHIEFYYYGGRGISFDERWKSFENFLEDMGRRPTINHTLDRKDVNGNYTKENCKWSNKEEQARNRRIRSTSTSGVRGVSWNKNSNKWTSYIGVNKKLVTLGSFKNKEDAIKARKEAELKYWGKSS